MSAKPTYATIVTDASIELEQALRRLVPGQQIHVYAMPTMAERDGNVVVTHKALPAPARYVRPSDNGASTHSRWEMVPYSALYGILWHALRCQPILKKIIETYPAE